ncbi:uncharacterized protein MRET_0074 [Malassezia restricta]|uniref:uncharacterized protein n=1 Tax=Malassezia restricta TaxID=76775 RepID=UPI000DD0F6F4|nr:uncharacterized protein MRET_0074 [Malassezia restricta]AXA48077.1 uncharacterized protein MRET_0074 [Malassezia restricta]
MRLHDGPSLKAFIHRAKVLALYRNFLRSTRSTPTLEARHETIAWFRYEIERARLETDAGRIQAYMMNGRMVLNQLEGMSMLNASDSSFPQLRGKRNLL